MYIAQAQGIFTSDKEKSEVKCPKCGLNDIWYRTWESSCGRYEDYRFDCGSCGIIWWSWEGSDA